MTHYSDPILLNVLALPGDKDAPFAGMHVSCNRLVSIPGGGAKREYARGVLLDWGGHDVDSVGAFCQSFTVKTKDGVAKYSSASKI